MIFFSYYFTYAIRNGRSKFSFVRDWSFVITFVIIA